MQVLKARHAWQERSGFVIDRKKGMESLTFLHFLNPVILGVAGERICTRPNACIIYDSFTPQYFFSEEKLVHNWLHAEVTGGRALLEKFGIACNRLYYPASEAGAARITTLFGDIETEFFRGEEFSAQMMEMRFAEVLVLLSRAEKALFESFSEGETPQFLRRIRGEVMASFDRKWSVEEMARRAGVCPSHFHSLYRKYFGISPVRDLILARLERAKSDLAWTDFSIEEIAVKNGFGTVFHFMREFKKNTGKTPGEYRRLHRRAD